MAVSPQTIQILYGPSGELAAGAAAADGSGYARPQINKNLREAMMISGIKAAAEEAD